MSFILHVDDQELYFEQFADMNQFIEQRLASWNNFEVETGRQQITITIMKPPLTNSIGISVNDTTQASERIS